MSVNTGNQPLTPPQLNTPPEKRRSLGGLTSPASPPGLPTFKPFHLQFQNLFDSPAQKEHLNKSPKKTSKLPGEEESENIALWLHQLHHNNLKIKQDLSNVIPEIEASIEQTRQKINYYNDLFRTSKFDSPSKASPVKSFTGSPRRVSNTQSPKLDTMPPRPSLESTPPRTTIETLPNYGSNISNLVGFSGKGTYIYPNGSQYTGTWLNGKKHGKGKMVYNDFSKYTGEWFNDLRHGWAVYTTPDYTYDGQWKNDVKDGRGLILYANGEKYEGEWKDNFPSSQGEYIFKDGSRYIGEFYKGLRHGRGVLYYGDGCTIYDGDWYNDKKHGKARITFINGTYEGDMRMDMKDGFGVYRYKNGDTYEGGWKNNKKHGVGIYRFAHGRGVFKGTWENGYKHGEGILEKHDGSRYHETWSFGNHVKKVRID